MVQRGLPNLLLNLFGGCPRDQTVAVEVASLTRRGIVGRDSADIAVQTRHAAMLKKRGIGGSVLIWLRKPKLA